MLGKYIILVSSVNAAVAVSRSSLPHLTILRFPPPHPTPSHTLIIIYYHICVERGHVNNVNYIRGDVCKKQALNVHTSCKTLHHLLHKYSNYCKAWDSCKSLAFFIFCNTPPPFQTLPMSISVNSPLLSYFYYYYFILKIAKINFTILMVLHE